MQHSAAAMATDADASVMLHPELCTANCHCSRLRRPMEGQEVKREGEKGKEEKTFFLSCALVHGYARKRECVE